MGRRYLLFALIVCASCVPAQLPLQPATSTAEITATPQASAPSKSLPAETPIPTRSEPSPTIPLPSTPTPTPLALRGGSLAFDRARGEAIYFGGMLANDCSPCGVTWVWDGSSWSPQIPPVSPLPATAGRPSVRCRPREYSPFRRLGRGAGVT
jgi:hypothetical protein